MEPVLSQLLSFYNRQTSFFKNTLKICGISCCYLIIRGVCIKLWRKYKLLPPGPVGYPIFGCFLSMAMKGHNFYIDIARINNCKYKLCTLPLGSLQCILINDDKLMKQILNDEHTQWRPHNLLAMDATADLSKMHGGSEWRERRKFFQTNLITMLNKKYLDKNIKLLMNQFLIPKLDKIANQMENNKNIWHWAGDFQFFTFNIMFNCVFGDFMEKNDAVYTQYMKDFVVALHCMQIDVFLYIFLGDKITPFLRRYLLGNKQDFYIEQQHKKCKQWALNAHKKYDENNLKTYYDHAYNQLSKQKSPNASYDDIITGEVVADFEMAIEGGTDTTAGTLEYCIVVAAKYPNIQEEIYKELDDFFNLSSKNIEDINILDNIQSLHKLRAFIFESLRLNPLVPALFRALEKDDGLEVIVDGNKYILPDKAIIIPNIVGMQQSPKLWRNPDIFDINRWLDDNGKFSRKLNPTLMSFTFGGRDCPGRPLAMKTLYLVISILFIKYRFYFDDPEKIKIKKKLDVVLHVHPEIPCKISKRGD